MRKLMALIKKEMLQILRDPSAILIAFVLPLILLFIFGYGVNLDNNRVKIGLVLEDITPDIISLSTTFSNSKFLDVEISQDRREFEDSLVAGRIRGIVIVPQDFMSKSTSGLKSASVQVIADGSDPNIATFVQNYVQKIVEIWMIHQKEDRALDGYDFAISVEPRFWYNSELKSRNFLIPGSIAIIMTLIGTILTALVIAREWERGTMESLLSTPVTIRQILLGKLIPYFLLGIGSMCVCWIIATQWYGVPFRGSFFALLLTTSIFLLSALGQGLLISSLAKDQFVASQMALISGFLPAFMLSGFVFEIAAMPQPIRGLTYIFSARYFVTSLQTLFLTGTIWSLLLTCMGSMLIICFVFFILIMKKTVKRLDA